MQYPPSPVGADNYWGQFNLSGAFRLWQSGNHLIKHGL